MTDQLQLFTPTPTAVRSLNEWEIDARGKGRKKRAGGVLKETAWDDGSAFPTSSTEKKPLSIGDRASIIGGEHCGQECRVLDVDGNWVSAELERGGIAALKQNELLTISEPETPETPTETPTSLLGKRGYCYGNGDPLRIVFSVDERHAKTERNPSGWIETQEKTNHGKKGSKTYHYHYYRYEIWCGGELRSTPAIRIEPSRESLLRGFIDRGFSVAKILELRHYWEKLKAKRRQP